MIRGIGIDSVEIGRFKDWHSFSDIQLRKIFSDDEIIFCRQIPLKSAERFAARFAVREAFFKALSELELKNYIPFLTVCKCVTVDRNATGRCWLTVDWREILESHSPVTMKVHISLTHDQERAGALVVIEEI